MRAKLVQQTVCRGVTNGTYMAFCKDLSCPLAFHVFANELGGGKDNDS